MKNAPSWVTNWERTGLIEWNDHNEDGRMFYSADERNEMRVDADIIVLASPEIANLPNWVIALVAAGGVAAALSTSAGLLLVISSSVSHDLMKRTLMPNISDGKSCFTRELQRVWRLSSVLGSVLIHPDSWRRWSPSRSVWQRPRSSQRLLWVSSINA